MSKKKETQISKAKGTPPSPPAGGSPRRSSLLPTKLNFPQMEEEVLSFWKKNKIFEKSVEQRSKDKPYSFYDGPPFVTGLPHYGNLLGSIAKDVYPRFFTMKGKRVRRVWGWDCHGLPVENAVEKKLGLKNRGDIEKIGLDKFINECRLYVSETSAEWNWYIDHIGRWADLDNAYRTLDLAYMESVIWAFKKLYDQGLIYKGLRVSLFCPRCSTPISQFEIAMDNSYKNMEDPAATVKFKVKNKKDLYFLVWTTAPWTLPANTGIAVGADLDYIEIKVGQENYILAKKLKNNYFPKAKVIKKYKGQKLIGWQYEQLFKQLKVDPKKGLRVIATDFVSNLEGTGLVTQAPGFGEEDFQAAKQQDLPIVVNVDDEGKYTKEMGDWAGVYYKNANELVIEELKKRKMLVKLEKYTHSYPYCYRCETPLIYKAQESWFVRIQKLKDKLLKNNENINWVPAHFKHGRFKKIIETAPDWCISRTRYWATGMPVWECSDCNQIEVFGSILEIEKRSGMKITDLHRPKIDKVKFPCLKCKGEMRRTKEVLDCWMESGSMPYAEYHYPFENKAAFEKAYPADYISEYTGQLRTWFYYLHVLSTALFGSESFKNCVVSGVMAGDDGRKMSKSYANYPDPKNLIKKYGGDSLRYVLMKNPLMMGRNATAAILESGCEDMVKKVLLPLSNSLRFLEIYNTSPSIKGKKESESNHILDRWLLSRTFHFVKQMEENLENYNTPAAASLIAPFIENLSTWYIRGSRVRFAQKDKQGIATLKQVLLLFSKSCAPLLPFISEYVYQILKRDSEPESVHLCFWPKLDRKWANSQLEEKMDLIREIVSLGHSERKAKELPVRQPLNKLSISNFQFSKLEKELTDLIKAELNVKRVEFKAGKGKLKVVLDTKLTPELKTEGEVRKLIRDIQVLRKKQNLKLTDKITIFAPSWPKAFEKEILLHTTAKTIKKGETLKVA
ncbi:isoleucine--tRNA ligase [Candidatus Shapirobacteria bacterium]|nr:isoleucine--tRNA ligase [Candidatus Shapirobacteria bacterium]